MIFIIFAVIVLLHLPFAFFFAKGYGQKILHEKPFDASLFSFFWDYSPLNQFLSILTPTKNFDPNLSPLKFAFLLNSLAQENI